jgi:hypothetical protein
LCLCPRAEEDRRPRTGCVSWGGWRSCGGASMCMLRRTKVLLRRELGEDDRDRS